MATNAELKARQAAAVAQGVATKAIYAARAENAELWDVEGRRYVDFAAGIAVTNTGHRHPKVMAAVAEQAQAFTHTCVHVSPYESYVALAEQLNALAPGDFPKKTLFLSTGAEAVENAIKIARYATGRSAIIAFSGAFHGRTMMAMALTGKVMPYKKGFGPFPAEVFHSTFPHAFHGLTRRARAGRPGAAAGDRRRSRAGRGVHRRAGAGRGRLQHRTAGVPAELARDRRQAWHPADRRRDPVGHGPNRQDVRHRALRGRAGPRSSPPRASAAASRSRRSPDAPR